MMETSKPISDKLASLIKEAVESVSDFYDSWARAVKLGKEEGLTVEELQEIARPLLRVKLSSKQVWYLFHQEEHKERSAKTAERNRNVLADSTNIRTNDVEKDIEESDIREQIQQDVPVTHIEDMKPQRKPLPVEQTVAKGAMDDDSDLPPEIQAIAAKQQQREVVEEGTPFRVAIVEKDLRAARDLVMRELTKLKGGGWKIIEVRTRRIT